jgi:formylglycine-generating enzyme required for sulfatase activity
LGCVVLIAWGAWEYRAQMRAQQLRDHLLSATVPEVPAIVEEMQPYRHQVEPLLHRSYAVENEPKRKLVLSLALLPSDASQVDFLYERLLQAAPQDFAVIRQALEPYKNDLTGQLGAELADRGRDSQRRFRAACALFQYSSEDNNGMAFQALEGLVRENPLVLTYWREALGSSRSRLLPALAASLEDSKWADGDRRAITECYREFSDGERQAFRPLEERLSMVEEAELNDVEQAKRKANVAAALVALDRGEKVWGMLVHSPSPTLRSYLIERLGSLAVDSKILANRLEVENETSARRALILALGNLPPDRLIPLEPKLIDLYESDPDAGVHAATAWALRKTKQAGKLHKIEDTLATGQIEGNRKWYINKQRQTFSVVDGLRPTGEKDLQKAPTRQLAIAATELTCRQFRELMGDPKSNPTPASNLELPVSKVSWYDAAEFCNRLSALEQISEDQWCYRPNKDGILDLVSGYQECKGYRLPTEEEWQYACRANAKTIWCFGNADEELVTKYAWWMGNAHASGVRTCFPVGQLKPNDWGLFDMHGNIAELCLNSALPPQGSFPDDIECGVRGGYFNSSYRDVASDRRTVLGRRIPLTGVGFRIVRTLP